jgi:N-acyl amino acid synthase of PEP-CTERM/exosortase system
MDKRDGPLVAMGLYCEIFKLALKHGVTHCYAAMEPSLARLLARIGFPFQMAGPLNTVVHPHRRPYFIGAHAVRTALSNRDNCLWQFIFRPSQVASVLSDTVSHSNWAPSTLQTEQSENTCQYLALSL